MKSLVKAITICLLISSSAQLRLDAMSFMQSQAEAAATAQV